MISSRHIISGVHSFNDGLSPTNECQFEHNPVHSGSMGISGGGGGGDRKEGGKVYTIKTEILTKKFLLCTIQRFIIKLQIYKILAQV